MFLLNRYIELQILELKERIKGKYEIIAEPGDYMINVFMNWKEVSNKVINLNSGLNKINEKADDYFEESINFSNFKSQQTKDKLNLRKNKIFNKLFAKRKENFENNIKDPNEIDINSLNCDESIKKDANYYVKNNYDIKNGLNIYFHQTKMKYMFPCFY